MGVLLRLNMNIYNLIALLTTPLSMALLVITTTTFLSHAEWTVLNVTGNLEAKYSEARVVAVKCPALSGVSAGKY